jgi:hypothetical protein
MLTVSLKTHLGFGIIIFTDFTGKTFQNPTLEPTVRGQLNPVWIAELGTRPP